MNETDIMDCSIQEIACGVATRGGISECLICHAQFEDGAVYECNGRLYEGRRAAMEHVRAEQGAMFLHLLGTCQQLTGLTAHQADILGRMAAGMSDKAIAEAVSGSSNTSAIRNLRFQLKEREKQAKAYLALMEAFRAERAKNTGKAEPTQAVHTGSSLSDERFDITEQERIAVLKTYFTADGTMKEFPVREKRKIIALGEIAKRFAAGRTYSEKEVNELIAYRDFATVRRYLIEYGFLERSQDCGKYWVKGKSDD